MPQTELIGRDAELDAIERLLVRTGGEPPSALVLEGEPGIGKTTLWRAGVELAGEHGYRVLIARPASAETQMPFVGLGDLLGGCGDDFLEDLPAPQRQALEAALLRSEPGASAPQPHTIAAAVLSSLRLLSREQPVLVAVDDVQWLEDRKSTRLNSSH